MSKYKVRLGDGTILAVDRDSLASLAVDQKAAVKTRSGWRLLKEILAQTQEPQPVSRVDRGSSNVPPPSTAELPSLRLAETREEADGSGEDVYEGDGWEDADPIDIGWLWVKRVMLSGALVAGGYAIAVNWDTLLPKAELLSRVLFEEIDRHARKPRPAVAASLQENEAREQQEVLAALQAAVDQLPHLLPGTVQLVMGSTVLDVLEPPEVFRRAYDAAERGTGSLPRDEVQELRALRRALVGALRPAEREKLRDWDHARVTLATLPFEDRAVLEFYVRAFHALPPASRDRLRALTEKAIAATLTTTSASAESALR